MFLSKYVHYVNLINIAALVGLSYWQIDVNNRYPWLIMPLLFGIMMLPMNNSLRDKNKQVIKVATVLTLLAFFPLVYASIHVFEMKVTDDILRVSVMLVTTVLSLIGLVNCIDKTKNNRI